MKIARPFRAGFGRNTNRVAQRRPNFKSFFLSSPSTVDSSTLAYLIPTSLFTSAL